jgi:chemotaxis protein methyltransferase CheR
VTAARSLRNDEGRSLVDGEYPLSRDDFQRIAGSLREQSGIHLPESKATLVYSRLAKRLRALQLGSFADYCRLIEAPHGHEERAAMLAALTTNVTRFFREPHHFDHLRAHVLEPAAAAVRAGARMRLWSSACSSGEEPYSVALTLLSVIPEAPRLDVKILATDIDPVVIEKAKEGVYTEECVSPIPPAMRERNMLKAQGGIWRVSDDVKSLIVFKQLNLIGDWPMRGKFDAIFCRNVVIYFEELTQSRIWSRFKGYLTPSGRLYVGHSERVDVPGYASDGLTAYRLSAGAPA